MTAVNPPIPARDSFSGAKAATTDRIRRSACSGWRTRGAARPEACFGEPERMQGCEGVGELSVSEFGGEAGRWTFLGRVRPLGQGGGRCRPVGITPDSSGDGEGEGREPPAADNVGHEQHERLRSPGGGDAPQVFDPAGRPSQVAEQPDDDGLRVLVIAR